MEWWKLIWVGLHLKVNKIDHEFFCGGSAGDYSDVPVYCVGDAWRKMKCPNCKLEIEYPIYRTETIPSYKNKGSSSVGGLMLEHIGYAINRLLPHCPFCDNALYNED